MYDTKGDVALKSLTSISRETNYLHDFVQYLRSKFFAFPQPHCALSMFLDFGRFLIKKKVLIKIECISSLPSRLAAN